MFQLTKEEFLRFQNGISRWGGTRTMPYAIAALSVKIPPSEKPRNPIGFRKA